MRPDRACIPRLDADNPRLNHDPALAGGTTACCHRSLRITAANARAGEIGSPARLPRSDFVRDLADALDVADGLAAAAVTDPAQLDPEFILGVRHGRSPSKAHPCGAHLRCVKTATFFVNVEKALSLEVATTPSTLTTILGCADKALSAFRRQCFYLALPIPCCAPRCPLKKRDEDARRFAARVTNADVVASLLFWSIRSDSRSTKAARRQECRTSTPDQNIWNRTNEDAAAAGRIHRRPAGCSHPMTAAFVLRGPAPAPRLRPCR